MQKHFRSKPAILLLVVTWMVLPVTRIKAQQEERQEALAQGINMSVPANCNANALGCLG